MYSSEQEQEIIACTRNEVLEFQNIKNNETY